MRRLIVPIGILCILLIGGCVHPKCEDSIRDEILNQTYHLYQSSEDKWERGIYSFRIGSELGENQNYFYHDYISPISEKIIDKEGNIKGEAKYRPIIKPIPNTIEIIEGRKAQHFEVVDVTFVSCRWVE